MSEMPLVFFTLLSQMAAGAFITAHVLERRGAPDEAGRRRVAYGVAGSMAFALLMSMTHLGHPEFGYRAMANLGSSWLSREILSSGAFFFVAVLACIPGARRVAGRAIGRIGSLLAAAMVFATSMVYTLPSHPAWNGAYPLVFFTLTAIASGMAFALMLRGGLSFGGAQRKTLLAALGLEALCFLAYACAAPQVSIAPSETALRLLIGVVLPFALLLRRREQYANDLPMIWAFILCGAFYGRILFYAGTHMAPMFGL